MKGLLSDLYMWFADLFMWLADCCLMGAERLLYDRPKKGPWG